MKLNIRIIVRVDADEDGLLDEWTEKWTLISHHATMLKAGATVNFLCLCLSPSGHRTSWCSHQRNLWALTHKQPSIDLTLRLLITTIVALEGGGGGGGGGSADFKACQTYYIPHATIQSKCSHTGVNLLSYKHATFHYIVRCWLLPPLKRPRIPNIKLPLISALTSTDWSRFSGKNAITPESFPVRKK